MTCKPIATILSTNQTDWRPKRTSVNNINTHLLREWFECVDLWICSGVSIRLVVPGVQAGNRRTINVPSFGNPVPKCPLESSSCVVALVIVLRCRAAVRRRHFSVDGRGDAAAVLVVVRQRQVQQAGAGGQVDVLHVLHLRPTHGTRLRERREPSTQWALNSSFHHIELIHTLYDNSHIIRHYNTGLSDDLVESCSGLCDSVSKPEQRKIR